MSISKEQSVELKKQLLKQVESMPNENKAQIKEHIKNLDEKGLEEFLKQNKIKYSESGEPQPAQPEKPIFQSIISGEIPSHKIDENDKSIAILEINPLSRGHCIILPKKPYPTEKIPKSAMALAQKIAKRIKSKLKPKDIKIETSSFQDYPMINIIPIYKDVQLEKRKAEEPELKILQNKLQTKKRASRPKKIEKKEDLSKLPKISFRIP